MLTHWHGMSGGVVKGNEDVMEFLDHNPLLLHGLGLCLCPASCGMLIYMSESMNK